MKHSIIILAFLLIGCRATQLKDYNKQLYDKGYLPFDNKIDFIENIRVQHYCELLGKDLKAVEKRYYDCVTIIKDNSFHKRAKVRCKHISYIPVTYQDMNKKKPNGRFILNNKIRNSVVYYIE